ncbi:MAG: exosortase A [Candidatus Thiodiazotropha sp.]
MKNNEIAHNYNYWSFVTSIIGFIIFLIIIIHKDTISSMVEMWWNSSTYGHETLLYPISLYLIYRKRHLIKHLVPEINYVGLLLLLFVTIIWWLGRVADVQVVEEVAVMALVPASVFTLIGFRATKIIAFPLLFVFISIPVWSPVEIYLQHLTSDVVVHILQLFDIPVFKDGVYISIPNGRFVVEEACAGLRYVLAMLTISLIYAHLQGFNILYFSTFVAISLIFSIIINWIRVFIVIYTGYAYGMDSYLVADHISFGWVLFFIAIIPVFWIGSRMPTNSEMEPKNSIAFEEGGSYKSLNRIQYYSISTFIVLLLLSSVPAAHLYKENMVEQIDGKISIQLPQLNDLYRKKSLKEMPTKPYFQNADVDVSALYGEGDKAVGVYIAHYYSQHQDKELASSRNHIYDENVWHKVDISVIKLSTQNNLINEAVELEVIDSSGVRYLMLYTYKVGDFFTTSEFVVKTMQILDRLGVAKGATIYITGTKVVDSKKESKARLLRLISSLFENENLNDNLIIHETTE